MILGYDDGMASPTAKFTGGRWVCQTIFGSSDQETTMPFSAIEFDNEIEQYFRLTRHNSVLDIGAGEGKYGSMLRRARPEIKLIAVETDADYVERYKLRDLYDTVRVMDAADLMNDLDESFDAVIIGDCIEHMRKSVGIDLLNFLVYRTKLIAVKFPLQMRQDSWEGHKSEAHLSVWSEHDFRGMDVLFAERNSMCLSMIRGYLNQTMDWIPAEITQRFGYANMADFYAREPWRLSFADIESRREQSCLSKIRAIVPSGATYILVDEAQTRLGCVTERKTLPFLENSGEYWGRPIDDQHAISEIERMRKRACTHVVFAWPALWWLQTYSAFNLHLRSNYRCSFEGEFLVVFDLRRRLLASAERLSE